MADQETPRDMIARLEMMTAGDDKWDLSDNDRAAIRYALETVKAVDALEAEVKRDPVLLHNVSFEDEFPRHPRGIGLIPWAPRTLRDAIISATRYAPGVTINWERTDA